MWCYAYSCGYRNPKDHIYHFRGQFFSDHLEKIKVNDLPVDFSQINLDYLQKVSVGTDLHAEKLKKMLNSWPRARNYENSATVYKLRLSPIYISPNLVLKIQR